ncbi:MAG: aspartyl/glutamyl-tRNA amidotransferase subunit C [Gammaproteobacteria bacterium]|nr:aspartyl/glutamyl-tRNA amidotransferase subunit C [Gammaproteobacteria bacterium]MDE0247447.1 aspartyl/glutamyl-tRNA amidotransferase subunit C [Gammaproteobacteria bacterium]
MSETDGKCRTGVTEDDVRAIAALARLRPREAAFERLTVELNLILEHVRALERLDLSGLDPQEAALHSRPRSRDPGTRPDAVGPDAVQALAPNWRDGFIVVPRLPALEATRSPARDPG